MTSHDTISGTHTHQGRRSTRRARVSSSATNSDRKGGNHVHCPISDRRIESPEAMAVSTTWPVNSTASVRSVAQLDEGVAPLLQSADDGAECSDGVRAAATAVVQHHDEPWPGRRGEYA